MVKSKYLQSISAAGILILLLLLIPSGRTFAQSYGWADSSGNCPWPGEATGPYASATSAYNACIARFWALGGNAGFQWRMEGEFTGVSDSDPSCTDPPTSAGVTCYVDIWYYYPPTYPWEHFGWDTLESVSSPQFWLSGNSAPDGELCSANCVGHPINPATGNVLSIETDIAFQGAGAIAYRRYYNSNDLTGADGVPGWRHSYDRNINVIYANPVGSYVSSTELLSAQYATPAAACTSGFNDLESSVPGWSGASASYSNGLCVITLNGVTIATPPINSAPITAPPQSTPIEYDVVRDDGQILRYPVQGGVVTNPPGISIRLAVTGSGYTVTDDDDDVETYNSSGVLESITSRSGVVQTISYSGGLFSGTTDNFGNSLSVARNAQNNIASVSVSGAGTVQYGYNSAQQLSQVTNLDSTTQSYTYDPRFTNALTGIIDENGITYSTWTYDSYERGTQTQEAGSVNTVNLTYNSNVSVTATDALGATRTFSYTRVGDINKVAAISGSQCPTCQESASTTYDNDGWVASRKDYNGNLTCYANDPVRDLELVRVEGFAPGSTCPSNLSSYTPQSGTLQRKITTQWSSTWREPQTITEPNRTTSFTFDSHGNVLTKTITDTSVTPNVSRTWTYVYYNSGLYGQVHTLTGPRTDITTDVTTYTFYSCTTGGQCGQIDTIANGLSQVATVTSYNAYGQPLTIKDANGVVTTLAYDTRERLTSRQTSTETTGYGYYPTGLLKTVTLPDSSTLTYSYENAHRLNKIADGPGNYITYTLDAMSNVTGASAYDPTGVLHRLHTRAYNTLSELYQDINAAGTSSVTTTYGYDSNGNQTSIDAPLSRNTANQFDALNRLNQITDPNNGITKLAYDANDNLASAIDPRSLTTTYTHDGFNEVTKLVSPDTGTTVNTFDTAGNLKTTKDGRAALATYTYDALNRVTQIAYSDQTIHLTYDSGTNGIGRLTGASDANHSMSWTYDALGRVNGTGQVVAGITRSVSYSYTNGALITLVTPSGQTVTYTYTNHRVTSISINGTTLLSGVTYDPFGPATEWTWGNNTSTVSRSYTEDGDPNQFVTAGVTNTYTVDYAQRITGLSDSGYSSNSFTFGYDLLDRVTSGSSSALSRGYTYDANGNRLTETGTVAYTASITPTNNHIASTTGGLVRTYGYDAAGNTTSYSGDTFTFNQRGRMSSARVSAGTSNYIYNALGQLIEKSGNGGTTLLVYDEAGHILGEYSSTGALIQETIWMGDLPVATLRPNGSSISIYYVHTDHLGTPRKVTQPATNTLAWRWDPDTFGSLAPNQNPAGLGTFVYNLRFPGQYYMAETGLNQNYFRDLDPAVGRYVESDPIGLEAGINTYVYVGSQPILFLDPYGLATLNALSWANNSSGPFDLYQWAENYNPAGFNSVVVHGNEFGQFSANSSGGPLITPQQLAWLLRQQPGYNPKLPTLLIACSSGGSVPSALSGAQAFANALAAPAGKNNMVGQPDYLPVYAPTTVITPQSVTSLPLGPAGQPGGFVPFYPTH